MENFERLGRQARQGIKPDTSRMPVFLRAELLGRWWGRHWQENIMFILKKLQDN